MQLRGIINDWRMIINQGLVGRRKLLRRPLPRLWPGRWLWLRLVRERSLKRRLCRSRYRLQIRGDVRMCWRRVRRWLKRCRGRKRRRRAFDIHWLDIQGFAVKAHGSRWSIRLHRRSTRTRLSGLEHRSFFDRLWRWRLAWWRLCGFFWLRS